MGVFEVVSSHHERAVIRAGDVFIKVETDTDKAAREVAALAAAPIPVPRVLWWREGSPALIALAAVAGEPLGVLGGECIERPGPWRAAGAVLRRLHDTPCPSDVRQDNWFDVAALPGWIDAERAWLLDREVADSGLINDRADFAHAALDQRAIEPAFINGDFQPAHVLIADDGVAGVVDWGDAGVGDPLYDLATLTVGFVEWLDAVIDGYGEPVDRDVITAYRILRRLGAVRWMTEHGYDPSGDVAALEFA